MSDTKEELRAEISRLTAALEVSETENTRLLTLNVEQTKHAAELELELGGMQERGAELERQLAAGHLELEEGQSVTSALASLELANEAAHGLILEALEKLPGVIDSAVQRQFEIAFARARGATRPERTYEGEPPAHVAARPAIGPRRPGRKGAEGAAPESLAASLPPGSLPAGFGG